MKASSSHDDMAAIATITHLLFASLGCRVYFEHVESGANVSDGLSRGGLGDDWTKNQGWYLVNAVLPNFQELSRLPFQELCQQLQSLLAVV